MVPRTHVFKLLIHVRCCLNEVSIRRSATLVRSPFAVVLLLLIIRLIISNKESSAFVFFQKSSLIA